MLLAVLLLGEVLISYQNRKGKFAVEYLFQTCIESLGHCLISVLASACPD